MLTFEINRERIRFCGSTNYPGSSLTQYFGWVSQVFFFFFSWLDHTWPPGITPWAPLTQQFGNFKTLQRPICLSPYQHFFIISREHTQQHHVPNIVLLTLVKHYKFSKPFVVWKVFDLSTRIGNRTMPRWKFTKALNCCRPADSKGGHSRRDRTLANFFTLMKVFELLYVGVCRCLIVIQNIVEQWTGHSNFGVKL